MRTRNLLILALVVPIAGLLGYLLPFPGGKPSGNPPPETAPIENFAPARREVDAPRVTIHLKDATLQQIADALPVAVTTEGPPIAGSYTLDIENRPLWEVVDALQKQYPFNVRVAGNLQFQIPPPVGPRLQTRAWVGPIYFGISASRSSGARGRGFGAATGTAIPLANAGPVQFQFTVAADPRLSVSEIHFRSGDFSIGPDAAGQTWRAQDTHQLELRQSRDGFSGNLGSSANYNGLTKIPQVNAVVEFTLLQNSNRTRINIVPENVTSLSASPNQSGVLVAIVSITDTSLQLKLSPPERAGLVVVRLWDQNKELRWTGHGTEGVEQLVINTRGGTIIARSQLEIEVAQSRREETATFQIRDLQILD